MQAIARIFKNGRSQAVRLPKEFRFQDKEVRITKIGNKVILEADFTLPEPLPGRNWKNRTLPSARGISRLPP